MGVFLRLNGKTITWIMILAFLLLTAAAGAQDVSLPKITIGIDKAKDPDQISASLQILVLLTVLSVAPALLIMTTAFSRIIIVLSFLRTALGTQNIPPNQLLVGLSLFLTTFIMAPTFDRIHKEALEPYFAKKISFEEGFKRAQAPMKDFMLRQTYTTDLKLFLGLRNEPPPKTKDELSILTLIPAFIISEMKTAFMIGFYIYVPFLVVDLVVASTLMSMGMMMMPPTVVSLPAKILVFILADGWAILIQTLVGGFR